MTWRKNSRRNNNAVLLLLLCNMIPSMVLCWWWCCCCFFFRLGITSIVITTAVPILDHSYDEQMTEHLQLFHHHDEIQVIGPSRFPRPTELPHLRSEEYDKYVDDTTEDDNNTIVPFLKPFHGEHRPDQDAVVAYAAEYPLSNYITFIESLRDSGFEGDVVLAVSPLDVKKSDVWDYLTEPGNHIVIYTPVLTCYTAEREEVDSAKGGSRTCVADHIYGRRTAASSSDGSMVVVPIPDPRSPRTVQTLRYEVYWLMCQAMSPHSWILLVDARDTVFQDNPFANVPRATDPTENSGVLYFFGENVDATRLGISKQNRKWLQAAYGDRVADLLAEKPTVCSGATMGEQVALDMYIRAMVAESDSTQVVLVGADQGFHNYLHYSHKLKNAEAIHSIVVFDQGQGIVNNMGALRTKELEEWGNGKLIRTEPKVGETNPKKMYRYTVLNWDGSISPVVHQYDRHKNLSDFFYKIKGAEWEAAYRQRRTLR